MEVLTNMNYIIAILFVACCFYQMIFSVVKLSRKRKKYQVLKMHRYAVAISARNEAAVISQLIESIRCQDYPRDLVDIYVVADNCTDDTAEIARMAGATVYERFNKELIGKGYALSYLFNMIKTEHADAVYDGYFVFDADNLLDKSYITEMNKVFSYGYPAVTSYRNTKNYGDSWVSACYGLWFLREAEYLNLPRSVLGISTAISGTGFLFSDKILERNGGWHYHLMTEDLEFTADLITHGEKIGYCGTAIIYDEQPKKLSQSIVQRSRWMKGGIQVMSKYGGSLARGAVKTGSFSCYDMLMSSLPAVVLTVASIILNAVMFVIGLMTVRSQMHIFFISIMTSVFNSYLLMYGMGLLVLITEWKKIKCPARKKILYSFMFPIFVLTFVVATAVALCSNVQWKPIKHTVALSISDLSGDSRKL